MAGKDKSTWKEFAGRENGKDGYKFGDVCRGAWKKVAGGGAAPPAKACNGTVEDADRALLDLKNQRDQLVNNRRRMESQASRDAQTAKELVKNDRKQQAMLALRKKKQHEQLALECQTHIGKLEELIADVEFASIQKETVAALATGVKTLKKIQQDIGGADYVASLMDECAEATAQHQEINEALASAGVAEDDADAMAEYARLVEEHAVAQLTIPAPVVAEVAKPAATEDAAPTPATPTVSVDAVKEDEEAEEAAKILQQASPEQPAPKEAEEAAEKPSRVAVAA
jgi:charged multivesicular body protein 6